MRLTEHRRENPPPVPRPGWQRGKPTGALRLESPLDQLPGIGPESSRRLEKVGLRTVCDLIFYFPRKYLDRSRVSRIADLEEGEEATIQGEILSVQRRVARNGLRIIEATVADGSGIVQAVWFNLDFLTNTLRRGRKVFLSGKVGMYDQLQMRSPEYEFLASDEQKMLHTCGIIPQYALTEGVGQHVLRRAVREALSRVSAQVADPLPAELRQSRELPMLGWALRQAHYPESAESLSGARRRLAYEELLLHQLALARRRGTMRLEPTAHRIQIRPELDERIRRRFPFRLTAAQERAIAQIRKDLQSGFPMHRLLEGDVGSGKTIVALYAMLGAVANRSQAALMAPTEILAEQHYRTLSKLLEGSRVRILLLTSALAGSQRSKAVQSIRAGEQDLVVGTHALIEQDVEFPRLSVAVIDEQHRFGVVQRSDFIQKGSRPHILIMTATPIPRTLAWTAFGDLDVSVLDELPPGRQPIKTYLYRTDRLAEAFHFIRAQLRAGRQAYFVYPLVDPSDRLAAKSATEMAKRLKGVFPEFRVELLHGQMQPAEKDARMDRFRRGEVAILVSTVVIEVGIDVPNATVMVIDHAERYGLAQLHQLRGRIGRGPHPSHCLLFAEWKTPEARRRLEVIRNTTDGFRIAEEDLRLRGPGDLLGVRQSGLPEFRVANLVEDFELVRQARQDAQALLDRDPKLERPEHRALGEAVRKRFEERAGPTALG